MARTVRAGSDARPAVLYVPAGSGPRSAVVERLTRAGVALTVAADAAEALRLLATRPVALALADLTGERVSLAMIRTIRARYPHVAIAVVADPANPAVAGEAMDAGASEVIPWPFEDRDVLTLLADAGDVVTDAAGRAPGAAGPTARIIAQSAAMRAVADRIDGASSVTGGFLVCGEPGSGRSVVARALHERANGRAPGAWIVEDCANRTPEDLDRRLFGVPLDPRRGRARGAVFDRIGRTGALYEARRGTLVLRHLASAPARIQGRLARLLRDREAELADQHGTPVDLDLKVIAAVDPDVDEAIGEEGMRADLFERLSQVRIDVPPLRRRREDVPVLTVLFLRDACDVRGIAPKAITRAALKVLAALPWHGNARELRALVDSLARAVDRPVVQLEDVLDHARFESTAMRMDVGMSLREAKARFERECISAVLARHHGRVGEAAKALGIQRTNLYRKVRQLQVVRPRAGGRRDR
jgi:DNA-binding NtrC family response regulator